MSRIFSCDVCSEEISAEKPRIHCQQCRAYDLCANCFVCGKTSRDHASAHDTLLFEMSGYVPRPPPVPPRPAIPQRPAAPPSPAVQRRPISMQVPRTDSGPSVSPPPPQTSQPPPTSSPPPSVPPFYPPPPSSTSGVPPRSTGPSPAPQTSYPPPPPQPPRPSSIYGGPPPGPPPAPAPEPQPQPAPTQTPPTGAWGPLFNGQSPTALGMAFFGTLFSCLDTDHTGLLRPEQYSAFLDVCGYTGAENIWKHQMTKSVVGYTREDLADYELKQAYINFSIEHQLIPRRATSPPTPAGWPASLVGALPPLSGGMMPVLTRQGFIDICAVEFLHDPARGWTYAKAASRRYSIWREWGEVPRSALPEVTPPELENRVKLAQMQAQARAQETLDATRTRLMIEKQGREAALDLVSDRRRYYY